MTRRRHSFAFTLIELIVVLIVIAIIMAVTIPSLGGWGQSRKLDNAVEQFLASTRWAQSQAISEARPYAIEIDPAAGTYRVETIDGDTRSPAAGEFGQTTAMPSGYTLAMTAGGSAVNLIVFQPDSRCTPATVRFTSTRNEFIDVSAASPAQPFEKAVAR